MEAGLAVRQDSPEWNALFVAYASPPKFAPWSLLQGLGLGFRALGLGFGFKVLVQEH